MQWIDKEKSKLARDIRPRRGVSAVSLGISSVSTKNVSGTTGWGRDLKGWQQPEAKSTRCTTTPPSGELILVDNSRRQLVYICHYGQKLKGKLLGLSKTPSMTVER